MQPLAICAVFRNEQPYLREWVEWHLMQGVSKIYLYNNESTDDWLPELGHHIATGEVEVIDWPGRPCQIQAYQHCLTRFAKHSLWLAFIDIDEFLWSPGGSTAVEALGAMSKTFGAVAVNWMIFGGGGQASYSPEPVIERFTWRLAADAEVNRHCKCIVNMRHTAIHGSTPHDFISEAGTWHECGEQVLGPFSHKHCSQLLRINHYSTKSRQEWFDRMRLGKPDRGEAEQLYNHEAWWNERQAMDVYDDGLLRWLPELKRRIQQHPVLVEEAQQV